VYEKGYLSVDRDQPFAFLDTGLVETYVLIAFHGAPEFQLSFPGQTKLPQSPQRHIGYLL